MRSSDKHSVQYPRSIRSSDKRYVQDPRSLGSFDKHVDIGSKIYKIYVSWIFRILDPGSFSDHGTSLVLSIGFLKDSYKTVLLDFYRIPIRRSYRILVQ